VQIRISTRHGSVSEETRSKINAKLEKLGRYFERITDIELTIDLERRDEPALDLKVNAEHKHDFVASLRGGELLASLDVVVHKVEQQLRKYKQKIQEHHRGSGPRQSEAPSDSGPDTA
jgi:putative sigma-54 modulation protein